MHTHPDLEWLNAQLALIDALSAELADIKRLLAERRAFEAKYNPRWRKQPRAPSGRPDRQARHPRRIALSLDHWAGGTTEPAVREAVTAAARALEAAGHTVEPIGRPFSYEQLMSTWFPLFGLGIAELIHATAARTGAAMASAAPPPRTTSVIAARIQS